MLKKLVVSMFAALALTSSAHASLVLLDFTGTAAPADSSDMSLIVTGLIDNMGGQRATTVTVTAGVLGQPITFDQTDFTINNWSVDDGALTTGAFGAIGVERAFEKFFPGEAEASIVWQIIEATIEVGGGGGVLRVSLNELVSIGGNVVSWVFRSDVAILHFGAPELHPASIPAPATFALFSLGLAGLAISRRKRQIYH